MVGRPQILLKRGTDQECRPHEGSHQKSIHAPLRRAHIQPHRDPRPAGQQREASAGNGVGWPAEHSELVEDGAGFHHVSHTGHLPSQAPGRASPPGPADSGLQGSPPSACISTSRQPPGAHTALPAPLGYVLSSLKAALVDHCTCSVAVVPAAAHLSSGMSTTARLTRSLPSLHVFPWFPAPHGSQHLR